MNTSFDYSMAIRERTIILSLIDQIIALRRKIGKGDQPFLNADFNMLFPYIWEITPDDVPEYKDYGKNLINLLSEHPKDTSEFSIYFTLPSFLELLDSFHHHARNAEHLLGQTKTYDHFQKSDFNKIIFDESSVSSGVAEKELKKIQSIAKSQNVKNCLGRAIDLIGVDGRVSGIDDLIHEGIHYNKKDINLFHRIFENMLEERTGRDKRKDKKDRYFHYKVDAANIVTTHIVNNMEGIESLFVTHQTMIDQFARKCGLNAQMPFIWLSSHLLCKHNPDRYGNNIDTFLKRMRKMTRESIGIMEENMGNRIPENDQQILDMVFSNYFSPIHRPTLSDVSSKPNELEDYDNSFESFVKLKSNLEETRDVIGDSVKSLASNVPFLLDSETMDVFGLNEDEMVLDIRKDFNI